MHTCESRWALRNVSMGANDDSTGKQRRSVLKSSSDGYNFPALQLTNLSSASPQFYWTGHSLLWIKDPLKNLMKVTDSFPQRPEKMQMNTFPRQVRGFKSSPTSRPPMQIHRPQGKNSCSTKCLGNLQNRKGATSLFLVNFSRRSSPMQETPHTSPQRCLTDILLLTDFLNPTKLKASIPHLLVVTIKIRQESWRTWIETVCILSSKLKYDFILLPYFPVQSIFKLLGKLYVSILKYL